MENTARMRKLALVIILFSPAFFFVSCKDDMKTRFKEATREQIDYLKSSECKSIMKSGDPAKIQDKLDEIAKSHGIDRGDPKTMKELIRMEADLRKDPEMMNMMQELARGMMELQ